MAVNLFSLNFYFLLFGYYYGCYYYYYTIFANMIFSELRTRAFMFGFLFNDSLIFFKYQCLNFIKIYIFLLSYQWIYLCQLILTSFPCMLLYFFFLLNIFFLLSYKLHQSIISPFYFLLNFYYINLSV